MAQPILNLWSYLVAQPILNLWSYLLAQPIPEATWWHNPYLTSEATWWHNPYWPLKLLGGTTHTNLWSYLVAQPMLNLWNYLVAQPILNLWSYLVAQPILNLWSYLVAQPILNLWSYLVAQPIMWQFSKHQYMSQLWLCPCKNTRTRFSAWLNAFSQGKCKMDGDLASVQYYNIRLDTHLVVIWLLTCAVHGFDVIRHSMVGWLRLVYVGPCLSLYLSQEKESSLRNGGEPGRIK